MRMIKRCIFCSNLMFLSDFLSFQIMSKWEMGKGAVAVFLMDEGGQGRVFNPKGFERRA